MFESKASMLPRVFFLSKKGKVFFCSVYNFAQWRQTMVGLGKMNLLICLLSGRTCCVIFVEFVLVKTYLYRFFQYGNTSSQSNRT